MASPLGGPAANLLVLLKVILLATLVVSAVAVGNVPGLKWSALEVWEGSASGDAWTRSLEYTTRSPLARVRNLPGYSRDSSRRHEDVVGALSAARHWRTMPFSCTCPSLKMLAARTASLELFT